jgi:hypothetical protein
MRFAARFDPALARKLRIMRLDAPVAEIARRLGSEATRLGLHRPSYACVRQHVAEERLRRAERDAALEVAALLTFTRAVVPTPEGIEDEYRRAVRRRLGAS